MGILSDLWQSSQGQKLALFCAVWPALFVPIVFILHYAYNLDANTERDDGVRQIPTISAAGSHSPASALLTYGLHMEAFALAMLFVAIYKEMERKIEQHRSFHEPSEPMDAEVNLSRFGKVAEALTLNGCLWVCCRTNTPYLVRGVATSNLITLLLGIASAFCMSMVGSIQVSANEQVHGSFAFLMFFFGTIHQLVFHFGIAKALAKHPLAQLLRHICMFVTIPFNILALVIAGIVSSSCENFHCRAFVVDLFPALEFSTVIAFLLYLGSFYWILPNTVLVTVVESTPGMVAPLLQQDARPMSLV